MVLTSQGFGLTCLIAVAVTTGVPLPSVEGLIASLIVGLAGAVGLTAFYKALAIGTMSIVAPIVATSAIVPVVVGLIGGDRVGAWQAPGMVAAAVGVGLATRGARDDVERRSRSRRSIAFALVATVSIGLALTALDTAADAGVVSAVVWARVFSVLILLGVLASIRYRLNGARVRLRVIAPMGVLDVGGTLLYALATTEGLLSVVAVTSSLYPIVTIALARSLLQERIRPIQGVGVGLALTGLCLLAVQP